VAEPEGTEEEEVLPSARRAPSVAVLSLREIRPVANYGGIREAEDVLVDALSAGLYRVVVSSPRFRRGALAKPAVRTLLNSSRVVHPYRIEHHQRDGGRPCEVLLVLARDLADASVLVGLPDWHRLGEFVIVHVESVTDWELRRYAEVVAHLRRRADALFAACEMPPLSYLASMSGRLRTVDVVPPMLDVLAFPVRADPMHRTIDVFCPGRVPMPQHQLLQQWAGRNEGSYQHDIGQLGAITSLDQHRKIFTSMATRARLFVTNHERYGGRQGVHRSVHTRFFEAQAAGCALVGDLPVESRLYAQYIAPSQPFALRMDAEVLPHEVLAALDDPEISRTVGTLSRQTALRRNDAAHRWKQMAELIGFPVAPGIEARIAELEQIAADGGVEPEEGGLDLPDSGNPDTAFNGR
jgi:hypothetical protein